MFIRVDYADDSSITLSDLRTRWEWDPFGTIRDFKRSSPAPPKTIRK